MATVTVALLSVLIWRSAAQPGMTWISGACLAAMVLSALGVGAAVALGWSTVGLLERVTIGAFEIWLILHAVALASHANLARQDAAD